MSFHKITGQAEIKQALRDHMLRPNEQRAPFLATIRLAGGSDYQGRKVNQGGLIIEGARPLGASLSEKEDRFTLTNSDSNYHLPIGDIRLADIEYIELLN